MKTPLTTFIIPSIDRPTLPRALASVPHGSAYLYVIDHSRLGESLARNVMIKQAATEWVSFLDDDDTVTCDYVERLQDEIDAHPTADVVIFREYFIEEDKFIPVEPVVKWGNVGISFSVKRDLALEYPFVEQKHEDLEFIKTLAAAGKEIVFSKYITYHVRH